MDNRSFFDNIVRLIELETGDRDHARLNGSIRSRMALKSCCVDGTPSSVFYYDAEDFELNPYDGVHGGFICCLFDVGMAVTCCAYADTMLTTTDVNIQYLRPMPKGRYRLITEITHAGNTLLSAVGRIVPEHDDRPCAISTISFIRVPEGYKIVQNQQS